MEYERSKKILKFLTDMFEIFWGIINPFMDNLFRILDDGKVLKRFSVVAGILLTVYCAQWSFQFALKPPDKYSGVDVAAIIGALMTPVSLLTGALMKYGDDLYKIPSKDNDKS